jgi:hypothetical protein
LCASKGADNFWIERNGAGAGAFDPGSSCLFFFCRSQLISKGLISCQNTAGAKSRPGLDPNGCVGEVQVD